MTQPAPRGFVRIIQPVQEFAQTGAAGGVVLFAAALFALAWANSPWAGSYHDLFEAHLVLDVGIYRVDESLHYWINDAGMVLFFLLVGLEIKRELTVGELNTVRRAVVPFAAALGGMVLPAAIFLAFVRDPDLQRGWGIPMATDIAFALGVATLLGRRVSLGLKALLLALAIFDDLGAIIVIAVFYSDGPALPPLFIAAALLFTMWLLARVGYRHLVLYLVLGIPTWVAARESGIHPTLVGVGIGLIMPWQTWREPHYATADVEAVLSDLRDAAVTPYLHRDMTHLLLRLRNISEHAVAPLDRLEHDLNAWVSFLIVPVFALANAGVDLRGGVLGEAAASPLAWGIAAGLILGKPVGVFAGSWLIVRAGAQLPEGVTWGSVAGVGALAGIGFTVALFVAALAYTDAAMLAHAKIGIFAASLASGLGGYALLRRQSPEHDIAA